MPEDVGPEKLEHGCEHERVEVVVERRVQMSGSGQENPTASTMNTHRMANNLIIYPLMQCRSAARGNEKTTRIARGGMAHLFSRNVSRR